MLRKHAYFLAFALTLSFAPVSDAAPQSAAATNAAAEKYYEAKGVIKELNPDGKTVVIAHETVTNYMPAMTMPFEVKNTNELRGLRVGDTVTFRMVVTEKDGWIDRVSKTGQVIITDPASQQMVRVVRDVPQLSVGDSLPNYRFTNELGKVVNTDELRGKAYAFTFFFTRCPYPNFCPFLSNNFQDAQKKLLEMKGGPTNWMLLSISFDTQIDSPAVLKDYATRYKYDPAHWTFLTGDLADISAIGDQVGEYFGKDKDGGINHNLRTVVVDTQGKITSIIVGNAWSSDTLVEDIVKAAKVKP